MIYVEKRLFVLCCTTSFMYPPKGKRHTNRFFNDIALRFLIGVLVYRVRNEAHRMLPRSHVLCSIPVDDSMIAQKSGFCKISCHSLTTLAKKPEVLYNSAWAGSSGVEHRTFNPLVVGSIPTRLTISRHQCCFLPKRCLLSKLGNVGETRMLSWFHPHVSGEDFLFIPHFLSIPIVQDISSIMCNMRS